jgi:hypothetical protein
VSVPKRLHTTYRTRRKLELKNRLRMFAFIAKTATYPNIKTDKQVKTCGLLCPTNKINFDMFHLSESIKTQKQIATTYVHCGVR